MKVLDHLLQQFLFIFSLMLFCFFSDLNNMDFFSVIMFFYMLSTLDNLNNPGTTEEKILRAIEKISRKEELRSMQF